MRCRLISSYKSVLKAHRVIKEAQVDDVDSHLVYISDKIATSLK